MCIGRMSGWITVFALSFFVGGCTTLNFEKADWCVKGRGLNVSIPLERGVAVRPQKCRSKEIYNRIFN